MEKKMYIAPSCEVVEIEMVTMIATSPNVGTGDDWEENEEPLGGNRHRGEWGNLWN